MISDSIFCNAFHSSPIGQYLLAATDELEIIAVNDAFLRSVSRRREEVLGTPLFKAFGVAPGEAGEVGVRALESSIRAAIKTGRAQLMPVQYYPIRMEQEGRVWFEDMYWSATNTPVYDELGALTCISHTTINITAQVLAEQDLQKSREQALKSAREADEERAYLAGVLEAAPVGVLVADCKLAVLHRNPSHAAMFGPDMPQDGGRIDFSRWEGWFVEGDDSGRKLEAHEWPLQRACHGSRVERCLLRVKTFVDDQAERTLLVSAAPIMDGDGAIVGGVAVSMDVEDRVRAEKALREADRRKDEFLAMLGHELRNPLAPIGAAAALLAHDGTNVEHARQSSAVIGRQVHHMTGLINELLDVARVTRGLITLDRTTLDLQDVVVEALEQMRPVIDARGHTIEVSCPSSPALVNGDRKRLVQMLANLLNNAAKFTPEQGLIRLDLSIGDEIVRLSVEDNGIGMTQELIDHAFELFTQAERTSDRSVGGLGIGLALARSLVVLHGGTITAHSQGAGHGTRFTVCLPRSTADSATPEAPMPILDQSTQGLKILIVDDNEDGLAMLELLLSSVGHTVDTTSRPRQVMERARALRPDVCLLDIGLPEIDGLALAGMLTADPATADSTLIAMSGYGQDADRTAALAAGFDLYLVKPVEPEKLLDTLAELAKRRKTGASR